ncbi:hypothetical protein C9374_000139 [Naegleria lovaniensis]|uniref:Uncharacterized protein n=1 Tax=Naegleria lovaniensis TaxID=51637 RepID=A0AA88GTP7_NAELO|nr:uncharacterized protein C9374_000139 [Naegleria lovaniensis]KAG2388700.1 hypothetical protein C9374_000139 [Naegleria lovaniensis]
MFKLLRRLSHSNTEEAVTKGMTTNHTNSNNNTVIDGTVIIDTSASHEDRTPNVLANTTTHIMMNSTVTMGHQQDMSSHNKKPISSSPLVPPLKGFELLVSSSSQSSFQNGEDGTTSSSGDGDGDILNLMHTPTLKKKNQSTTTTSPLPTHPILHNNHHHYSSQYDSKDDGYHSLQPPPPTSHQQRLALLTSRFGKNKSSQQASHNSILFLRDYCSTTSRVIVSTTTAASSSLPTSSRSSSSTTTTTTTTPHVSSSSSPSYVTSSSTLLSSSWHHSHQLDLPYNQLSIFDWDHDHLMQILRKFKFSNQDELLKFIENEYMCGVHLVNCLLECLTYRSITMMVSSTMHKRRKKPLNSHFMSVTRCESRSSSGGGGASGDSNMSSSSSSNMMSEDNTISSSSSHHSTTSHNNHHHHTNIHNLSLNRRLKTAHTPSSSQFNDDDIISLDDLLDDFNQTEPSSLLVTSSVQPSSSQPTLPVIKSDSALESSMSSTIQVPSIITPRKSESSAGTTTTTTTTTSTYSSNNNHHSSSSNNNNNTPPNSTSNSDDGVLSRRRTLSFLFTPRASSQHSNHSTNSLIYIPKNIQDSKLLTQILQYYRCLQFKSIIISLFKNNNNNTGSKNHQGILETVQTMDRSVIISHIQNNYTFLDLTLSHWLYIFTFIDFTDIGKKKKKCENRENSCSSLECTQSITTTITSHYTNNTLSSLKYSCKYFHAITRHPYLLYQYLIHYIPVSEIDTSSPHHTYQQFKYMILKQKYEKTSLSMVISKLIEHEVISSSTQSTALQKSSSNNTLSSSNSSNPSTPTTPRSGGANSARGGGYTNSHTGGTSSSSSTLHGNTFANHGTTISTTPRTPTNTIMANAPFDPHDHGTTNDEMSQHDDDDDMWLLQYTGSPRWQTWAQHASPLYLFSHIFQDSYYREYLHCMDCEHQSLKEFIQMTYSIGEKQRQIQNKLLSLIDHEMSAKYYYFRKITNLDKFTIHNPSYQSLSELFGIYYNRDCNYYIVTYGQCVFTFHWKNMETYLIRMNHDTNAIQYISSQVDGSFKRIMIPSMNIIIPQQYHAVLNHHHYHTSSNTNYHGTTNSSSSSSSPPPLLLQLLLTSSSSVPLIPLAATPSSISSNTPLHDIISLEGEWTALLKYYSHSFEAFFETTYSLDIKKSHDDDGPRHYKMMTYIAHIDTLYEPSTTTNSSKRNDQREDDHSALLSNGWYKSSNKSKNMDTTIMMHHNDDQTCLNHPRLNPYDDDVYRMGIMNHSMNESDHSYDDHPHIHKDPITIRNNETFNHSINPHESLSDLDHLISNYGHVKIEQAVKENKKQNNNNNNRNSLFQFIGSSYHEYDYNMLNCKVKISQIGNVVSINFYRSTRVLDFSVLGQLFTIGETLRQVYGVVCDRFGICGIMIFKSRCPYKE